MLRVQALIKMNQYSKLLQKSLKEIDIFSQSENGDNWSTDWYVNIKILVINASTENDQERAEELLDMVTWSIVDSGPLGCDFAPSIDQAQEALVKVRRQREINKHKKA